MQGITDQWNHISSMCANDIVITGMQEFDYDICGMFEDINDKGFPLSMILEGRKEEHVALICEDCHKHPCPVYEQGAGSKAKFDRRTTGG